MALDTRSKRASSVGILLGFCLLAPPLPDGTIGQADRQHIAWSYSGISAEVAVSVEVDAGAGRRSMRDRPRFQPLVLRQGGRIAAIVVDAVGHGWVRKQGGALSTLVIDTQSDGQKSCARASHVLATLVKTSQCGLQLVRPGLSERPSRLERRLWALALRQPVVETPLAPIAVDDDELALRLLEIL